MASRRLWVPALVGLLVAGLLGSDGGAGAVAAGGARVTTGKIMIPAAAFTPTDETWDYYNTGSHLRMLAGGGSFLAVIPFPVPEASIRRITLYAYDETNGSDICVQILRSSPAAGDFTAVAGQVCTSGTSPTNPQVQYTTGISPRAMNTERQGPFLFLSITGPGPKFYGVQVSFGY